MLLRAPQPLEFPAFHQRFPWLGPDLQTLRNTIMRTAPSLRAYPSQRLYFPCHDGSGDVLQGILNQPATAAAAQMPLIVLIHGLTGSEDSAHLRVSAAHFLNMGQPVLRMNLRGAGPSRMTCKGHYHAGRSEDIAAMLSALPHAFTAYGVFLMAVSLGGNVLLKFLADYPRFDFVKAAGAVSPPVDLAAAQRQIMQPRNRVYHRHLLSNMKEGADWADLIEKLTPAALTQIDSIYAFDDQIVAPANGFRDAPDYYQQSSALPVLDAIDTPTLIIHPQDDPWVPLDPLAQREWDPHSQGHDHVYVIAPQHGGHIGLHGQGATTPWHNVCASQFFAHVLENGPE